MSVNSRLTSHFFVRIRQHGIVIDSKILHFYISCFSYGQYNFLNFFFKPWWLVPRLWLIKFSRYFHQKLIFDQKKKLTQMIFRSQHRHTSFLDISCWYIMEVHHKKWKIYMCTCWLLNLGSPEKMFFSKLTQFWA